MFQSKHRDILRFISAIRESHTDMLELYTNGQCYNFHLILRSVYKDAQAYYNGQHVYTKIDDKFYDIQGVYLGRTKGLYKLDYGNSHKPHRWGKGDRRRLWNT